MRAMVVSPWMIDALKERAKQSPSGGQVESESVFVHFCLGEEAYFQDVVHGEGVVLA